MSRRRGAPAAAPTTRRHRHPPFRARSGLVAGPGRDAAVPILMYHVIAAPPIGAPFPQLYVTATEFSEQMAALYRAGWTAVTMDQVWDAWTGGARLNPAGHPIVISFDNGYTSQYHVAMPVLRHYHWLGVENIQLTGLPRSQGGLSRRATERLVARGWEVDTQGFSHADLVKLDDAALRREVAASRRVVSRRYGVPGQLVLLPVGSLRRPGRRRGPRRGLPRGDDRLARLGPGQRRPLPAAPPARRERDHPGGAAEPDRRRPSRSPGPARVRGGMSLPRSGMAPARCGNAAARPPRTAVSSAARLWLTLP